MITEKAAVSDALREQWPRVTLEKIKKYLNVSQGMSLKINSTAYKIIELYEFHFLTVNNQYGWKESFTYGEIWALHAKKMRR